MPHDIDIFSGEYKTRLTKMKYTLDLTSYLCPLPLLMAKQALKTLPQGAKLTILLNPHSNPADFRLLCEEFGYTFSQSEPLKITLSK